MQRCLIVFDLDTKCLEDNYHRASLKTVMPNLIWHLLCPKMGDCGSSQQ